MRAEADRHSANGAQLRRPVVDCWSKIGVHGDSSCPELQKFVRCRNCPVYSATAKSLLDVELPADYLTRSTLHVAREQPATEPNSLSVVVFRVAAEWFALPTTAFVEIVAERVIHSIPHRRGGVVLGLANVRGELLACVSLRKVLGLQQPEEAVRGRRTRGSGRPLLVLEQDGTRVVCPVDEVRGVERYHPRDLLAVSTIAKGAPTYITAMLPWEKTPVGMLEQQLLFRDLKRRLASSAI